MEVSLVRELAKYPILYDTTLEEYKHVELKNAAWREITSALFHTTSPCVVERVKNKWKNLRDTFVKSQRKKDRPNSKPWKLENEMKFLIPHISVKMPVLSSLDGGNSILYERLVSSSPEHSSREKELSYLKREREEDMDRLSQSMDEYMPVEAVMDDSPKVINRRKRKRESFTTDAMKHLADNSEMLSESPRDPRDEMIPIQFDPIDSFFHGVAQTVKRLKPIDQVRVKKAIANLIFDAELKTIEDSCEASSSSVY